jgi:hypothetical protein
LQHKQAKIVYISGNHEARLSKYILNNAAAAFGIKKACGQPEEWPVLTVPNLLRLDELKIEYISGWPNGELYLNDKLKVVHGEKLKAKQVAADYTCSTIQGHAHRICMESVTRKTRYGYDTNYSYFAGCLCKIDGSLPSTKSSIDEFGRPVVSPEQWQQGFAVVGYDDKECYNYEQVLINGNKAIYRDKVFEA